MRLLVMRTRLLGTGALFLFTLLAVGFLSTAAVAQGTISATYCISGTSSGGGWQFAWEYDDGVTFLSGLNYSQLPVGAPCSSFAQAMADSMNFSTLIPPEYVASASGCCLVITMSTGWNWGNLWVGSPSPNCLVTTAGCTFNPTIVLMEEPVADAEVNWGTLKSRYRGPDGR